MNYNTDYWQALTRTAWNVPSPGALGRLIPASARNPAGSGNSKTELPGTYRPVGATCPSTCEALGNGCYAQGGRVHMQAKRAAPDAVLSGRAAVFAMVAAVRYGSPARLHVSGDFGLPDGSVDSDYVSALCAIGAELRRLSGADVVAYTYTHFGPDAFGEHHARQPRPAAAVPAEGGARMTTTDFHLVTDAMLYSPRDAAITTAAVLHGLGRIRASDRAVYRALGPGVARSWALRYFRAGQLARRIQQAEAAPC